MKRKIWIVCIAAVIVAAVLLVPGKRTWSVQGEAVILNLDKEPVGTGEMALEVAEYQALARLWGRTCSFRLDGQEFRDFEEIVWHQAEGEFTVGFGMYYDSGLNGVNSCSVLWPEDRSYAAVRVGEQFWVLDLGMKIPYEEIPLSHTPCEEAAS